MAGGGANGNGDDPEPELSSLQVTYPGKGTGDLCKTTVFCDPADWAVISQKRFLVSSDLVNLLSETVAQRQVRFHQWHHSLANYRFGYTCVLHRIRSEVSRLAAVVAVQDEDGQAKPTCAEAEVCPVHFFSPEKYIDRHTWECLEQSIRLYKAYLLEEIEDLKAAIEEHGGSGWYDIMKKMIGKDGADGAAAVAGGDAAGISPPASPPASPTSASVASPKSSSGFQSRRKKQAPRLDPSMLCDMLLDKATEEDVRELENKISGGMRDLHDKLQPLVEELEPEYEDYSKHDEQVQNDIRHKNENICSCEERLRDIARKLRANPPHILPDSGSDISDDGPPPDDSAFRSRVAQLVAALLAEWAQNAKDAAEEAARAKVLADEMEAQLRAAEKKANIPGLRAKVAQLESSVQQLRCQLEALRERGGVVRGGMEEKVAEAARLLEEIEDLKAKIAAVPPPSPRSNRYQEILEQIEHIQAAIKRLKEKLKNPEQRWRSIRWQLKKLYENFNWEWEFSESESESDEKPYWMRRKLAAEGMGKFDACAMSYQENSVRKKRQQKTRKSIRERNEQSILNQMVANRHLHSEAVAGLLRECASAGGAYGTVVAPFMAGELAPADQEKLRRKAAIEGAVTDGHVDSGSRCLVPGAAAVGDERKAPGRPADGNCRSSPSKHRLPEGALPSSRTGSIQQCCLRVIRIQEAKSSCMGHLWRCATQMPASLPDCPSLMEAKLHLQTLAKRMGDQMVLGVGLLENCTESEDEVLALCASVLGELGKAIQASDKASDVADSLELSAQFTAFQSALVQHRAEHVAALDALREAAGQDALQTCSTRLPSLFDSLLDEDAAAGSSARRELLASPSCGGSSPRTCSRASGDSLLGPPPSRGMPRGAPPSRPADGGRCSPVVGSGLGPLVGAGRHRHESAGGYAAGRGRPAGALADGVDFGFRPDGAGEESLESWRLFKVSKGATTEVGAVSGTAGSGLLASRAAAGEKVMKISDERAARLQQRLAAHCDFREYVSQQRRADASNGGWRSTSAPDLFKRGPSLPQLVHRSQQGCTAGCGR